MMTVSTTTVQASEKLLPKPSVVVMLENTLRLRSAKMCERHFNQPLLVPHRRTDHLGGREAVQLVDDLRLVNQVQPDSVLAMAKRKTTEAQPAEEHPKKAGRTIRTSS